MHILAEGYGEWDGNVVNPQNPQRRDVHILHNAQPDGTPSYMVIQIEADNPGVWRKSQSSVSVSSFQLTFLNSFPLPRRMAHVWGPVHERHVIPERDQEDQTAFNCRADLP